MGQMRGAVVGILPDQIAVPVVFVQEPAGAGCVDITIAPLAMRRVVAQQVAVGQQVTDQSRYVLRMPLVDDVPPFVHEICRGGRIRGKQHVSVLGAGVVEKQTGRLREHQPTLERLTRKPARARSPPRATALSPRGTQ